MCARVVCVMYACVVYGEQVCGVRVWLAFYNPIKPKVSMKSMCVHVYVGWRSGRLCCVSQSGVGVWFVYLCQQQT